MNTQAGGQAQKPDRERPKYHHYEAFKVEGLEAAVLLETPNEQWTWYTFKRWVDLMSYHFNGYVYLKENLNVSMPWEHAMMRCCYGEKWQTDALFAVEGDQENPPPRVVKNCKYWMQGFWPAWATCPRITQVLIQQERQRQAMKAKQLSMGQMLGSVLNFGQPEPLMEQDEHGNDTTNQPTGGQPTGATSLSQEGGDLTNTGGDSTSPPVSPDNIQPKSGT